MHTEEYLTHLVEHLRQPEPRNPRKVKDDRWPYLSDQDSDSDEEHAVWGFPDWQAQDYTDFAQEIDTVEEVLECLDPNDFETDSAFDERQEELRRIHRSFEQDRDDIEGWLLEGDNPRGTVYYIPVEMPMRLRQQAAELAEEVHSTAVSRTINHAANIKEAWDENDYEKVIELASRNIEEHASASKNYDYDGVQQLCANLQCRFKAYQAMKLFSLAAADANRAFELLAEFGVDSSVNLGLSQRSSTETFSASQKDPHGRKRVGNGSGATESKRRRIGSDGSTASPPTIFSLLPDLLLRVSEFLQPEDRIHLANTCAEFRKIPELWQHLVFRRIRSTLRVGWHRDTIDACVAAIDTCQRRSHGALISVALKGFILPEHLESIFEALRGSLRTLKFVGIPTADQIRCYRELYSQCRSLTGVDVRLYHRHSDDTSRLIEYKQLGNLLHVFPPEGELTFQLKYFLARPDFDCGDISPHMDDLEVVEGVCHARQKQASFIKGIISAAETLREWTDCAEAKWDSDTVDGDDFDVKLLPTAPVIFPRLCKLSGLWAEHFIECEFPSLEEASINSVRIKSPLASLTMQDKRPRVVTIIAKSPNLKKLDILLPASSSAQKEILIAVAELEHLEELRLWSKGPISLQPFVALQEDGSGANASIDVVCPKLHTLGVFIKSVTSYKSTEPSEKELERQLCEFLIMRFFGLQGCRRGEAMKRTEAAMAVYDKSPIKMNKTQKKELMTEAISAAGQSTYKGRYQTIRDLKRELFTPVLSRLELSSGFEKLISVGNDQVLAQLVTAVRERDVSKEWGHGKGDFYYH